MLLENEGEGFHGIETKDKRGGRSAVDLRCLGMTATGIIATATSPPYTSCGQPELDGRVFMPKADNTRAKRMGKWGDNYKPRNVELCNMSLM